MRIFLLALLGALATSSATSIQRRAGVSGNLPSGWSYQGCYTDNVPNRVLSGASYADGSQMTEESCISFCSSRGFSFAGVEYAQECYCDYQLANASTLQPDTDCSMTCSGNSAEACGAGNRLTVFSNGGGPPVTNPGPNGWESLGCYTDSASKTLVNRPYADQNASAMTVATCTSACQASGYAYAGLEYGGECYCGFWISNDGTPTSDGCTMTCNGNQSEFCGGSNRLNIYQLPNETAPVTPTLPNGWSALGCWTDNVQGRTLATGEPVPGGYTNMTIENCLSACQSNGFSLAGVEYSQECFCANEISNGGACASDSQTCNMPCRGNTNEICGGANRLNVFQFGAGSAAACTPVTASSTSSASSATSTTINSTSTFVVSTSTSTSTSSSSTIVTSTSVVSFSTTSTSPSSTPTAPSSSSSSSSSSTVSTTTSMISSVTSSADSSTSISTIDITTSSSSSIATSVISTLTTLTSSTSTSAPFTSSIITTSSVGSTMATSTTAAACTATGAASYGNLVNGGFESGLSPWTFSVTNGAASVSVVSDGKSFAGCQELFILPTSSPGLLRQVIVSQPQTPTLVPGRIYTLTMMQGRNSSAVALGVPSIAIRMGSTTITVGPSCSGSTCTLSGKGGSVYQRISVPFVAPLASSPLSIVLTWTDANVAAPILLDEISIKQPGS